MKFIASVVVVLAILGIAFASSGVDISQAVSTSAFHCLKSAGIGQFAIARVGTSLGRVDPNGAVTIKNAHAAGVETDGYIFPCPHCGDPEGQVKRAVEHLRSSGAHINRLWLDIEGTQYWTGGQAHRQSFFKGLVAGCHSAGVAIGVYTSASQWAPIMGSFDGGKLFPLWYAHYDGHASFSDFHPFGGLSSPHIKQYIGDASHCGVGVDVNFKH